MELNPGNTAWMIAATALVLFMTPGLAFFYGGMVRSKNVLGMLMQNFICMGIVGVLWVLFVFSLAFGPDKGNVIGDIGHYAGLAHGNDLWLSTGVPVTVIAAFQMTFAIITPALIAGAIADRMKFISWNVFVTFWLILAYAPLAHWVWGGGFIATKIKAIDFAGGTVVHINAGIAALVLAIILGKRAGWPKEQMKPHSMPLVMLGAAMLWFGWIGFNAGSELAADTVAGYALINTIVATSAAMLSWLVVEKLRDGHATSLGAASGLVAGLVAITPACGFVNSIGAIVIGLAAGVICALAVALKFRFGYDDSLDVVGVHLVGGITGALLTGLFCTHTVFLPDTAKDGLFYGGGATQLGRQFLAVLVTLGWTGAISAILALIIKVTIGLRISHDEELEGMDSVIHAESAYELTGSLTGALRSFGSSPRISEAAGKVDA